MAEQVLIPEKRGGINRLMDLFNQGSSMLQTGAKGKEGYKSLMSSGDGGGDGSGIGGIGGGYGAYTLGAKAFKPASDGMSSELGGGSTAAGGESAASFIAPAAALGTAGYGEYQTMKNPSSGSRYVGNRDVSMTGAKLGDKLGTSKMPSISGGLSLTSQSGGNKMPALERRYQNSQNAMSSIDAAQKALAEADLPDAERRSINQKLELAKRSGGQKRGSSIYS